MHAMNELIAALGDAYDRPEAKFILALLVISVVQFWVTYIALSARREHQKRRITEVVENELEDLIRHCESNIQILDKVLLHGKSPLPYHVKRLKFPSEMIVVKTGLLGAASRKVIKKISNLSLVLRNTNDMIDECVGHCEAKERDGARVLLYMSQIRDRFEHINSRLRYDLLVIRAKQDDRIPTPKNDIVYFEDDPPRASDIKPA